MILLAFTSLAFADLVSGPESCVIEAYDAAHCVVCDGPSFQDEDVCKRQHGSTKKLACKTQGASVWSEIWCDAEAGGTTKNEVVPSESRRCSTTGEGGWLAAVIAAALVLRKRK